MKETFRLYTLLSAVLILVHFATLRNLLPWVDEVMFADTPMHFVKGMGWTTFAWYRGAQQVPFQTYQPLYAFLLAGWMKLFGTTLQASRSLNLAIVYLLGLALLRLWQSFNMRISKAVIVAFTLILWTAGSLSWMTRNGRPDLLGALCAVLTLLAIVRLIRQRSHARFLVVAGAALLALAGLPACMFLVLVVAWAIAVYGGHRRQLLCALGLSIGGMTLGLLLTMLFMAYHGHLLAYLANVVAYSAALKHLAALALPYLAQPLGLDPAVVLPKLQPTAETSPSSLLRALGIFRQPDYLVLLAITISSCFLSQRCRSREVQALDEENGPNCSVKRADLPCKMARFTNQPCGTEGLKQYPWVALLGLLIPLLMSLAGRFERYYYWMALLPLLWQVVMVVSQQGRRLRMLMLAVVVVGIVLPGLHAMTRNSHASEQHDFLSGLAFLEKRKVAAPFSVFYDVAAITDSAYYAGVFPTEFLPDDLDYIILPAETEYGYDGLWKCYEAVGRCHDVVLVVECRRPVLRVFAIYNCGLQPAACR